MVATGRGSEILYATEKVEGVKYSSFIALAETQKASSTLDKTTLRELCNLASSEKDKLLIKYVCCKSQNLSMSQARQLYGFWNFNQQKEKIDNALLEMKEIHDVIEELAAIKDSTVLQGFGICVQEDSSSCESECSLSDAESSETEWISDDEKDQPTPSPLPLDDQLLSMLRTVNFNWFAFVTEVKMQLPNNSENTLLESGNSMSIHPKKVENDTIPLQFVLNLYSIFIVLRHVKIQNFRLLPLIVLNYGTLNFEDFCQKWAWFNQINF